jgi:hypothetical protein
MTTPTLEDLQTQLTEAQSAVTDAERRVGAAALDGKGKAAAQKALDATRAEVTQIEAAIEELQRRDADAAQQVASEGARAERIALYEWTEGFCERYAELLRRKAALEEAERELRDLTVPGRIHRLKTHGAERVTLDGSASTRLLSEIPDLDFPLLSGIPTPARGKEWKPEQQMTVERLEELRTRAAELAKAEREDSTEGILVTGPQWIEQRQAQRLARRAAAKAQQAAELAARSQPKSADTVEEDGRMTVTHSKVERNDDGEEVRGRGSNVPAAMHAIERQQAGVRVCHAANLDISLWPAVKEAVAKEVRVARRGGGVPENDDVGQGPVRAGNREKTSQPTVTDRGHPDG